MRRRGASLIEVLVATIILSVCLSAILGLASFAFNITGQSDERSIAYAVGRDAIELVRTQGFDYAVGGTGADGSETFYYDRDGVKLGSSTGAEYSATITVTSDVSETTADGSVRPTDQAIRTVIVVVVRLSTGQEVHREGTMLARSGV